MLSLLLIWSDWSISLARIILGILIAVHGIPKIKNIKGTAEWMSSNGFKPGIFWSIIVSVLESFGGFFLIFGFLTQYIALLLSIQFIVIIIWKILKHQSFSSLEIDLLVLVICLILLFNGSKALSIDQFFGLF